MTLRSRISTRDDEFALGLAFHDNMLLAYTFWADALTMADKTEPELSLEQKLMFLDESPQVLFCTGRKIAKCLAADNIVYDTTLGKYITVLQLYHSIRPISLQTMNTQGNIVPSQTVSVAKDAVRPIFKVTTRLGAAVRVSGNHPFLTRHGWVDCSDLKIGDLVGMCSKQNKVVWESIASIEPDGVEQTYDIEVPETHNFVVNGFITHNSILLESRILRYALTLGNPNVLTEIMVTTPSLIDNKLLHGRVMAKYHSDPLIDSLIRERGSDNPEVWFNPANTVVHFRLEGLCVAGDTIVRDFKDGRSYRIDEITEEHRPRTLVGGIPSYNCIFVAPEYTVVYSGKQELFEIKTKDGHSIKATANHPFFTPGHWVELSKLSPGWIVGTFDENKPYLGIVWSVIESIESVGVGDTYDLRVPDLNSFVGNGFVLHNSGRDTNMRGLRLTAILGDEQQGSNWACHDSRKMAALPGCKFLYCGVPDGVRSTPFFALDQTVAGRGWSRHKYPSFINPIFSSQKERDRLIRDYGGEASMSYITQVLGDWGDEMISSFPPGTIAYRNELPIYIKTLTQTDVRPYAITGSLGALITFPSIRCYAYAIGIDYGATSDPLVIIIGYQKSQGSSWLQYIRLTLQGVEFPYVVRIILYLMNYVMMGNFTGMSTDLIALVQSTVDELKNDERSSRVFWSNVQGAILEVDEEGRAKRDAQGKELKVRRKQHLHETLREYMVNAIMDLEGTKLWLGGDEELIEELRGTTEQKTQGDYMMYHSSQKLRGKEQDHRREALIYLVDAIERGTILTGDSFTEMMVLEALGWAGDQGTWKAPWEESQ